MACVNFNSVYKSWWSCYQSQNWAFKCSSTQTKWKGLTRILVFIGKQWLPLSKAPSVRCTADWIWQNSHSFSSIGPRSADRETYRNRGPEMMDWEEKKHEMTHEINSTRTKRGRQKIVSTIFLFLKISESFMK